LQTRQAPEMKMRECEAKRPKLEALRATVVSRLMSHEAASPPTSWGPGGALWAPPAGSGAENFYLIFLPKHHVRTAKQVFLTQWQHFKMLLFKSREKV